MEDKFYLCYVDGNKAWFTDDFENQWGDDWDDAPYEYNAGEPYNEYYELIEDNADYSKRKFVKHEIHHKIVYFETNDYTDTRPFHGYENSPYTVEDINKKKVPWIITNEYRIWAGTSYKDFVKTIKNHFGNVYVLKEDNDE